MSKRKISIDLALLTFFILLLCFSISVKAVLTTFHGTLIDNPPCDIEPADVLFDEIGISQIDGVRYKKIFTIKISCNGDLGQSIPLYLGYEGMTAPFNYNALQTSKTGLGIVMSHSGDIIPPNNEDIPVTMSSNGIYDIELEAVPVKDSTPPTEGDFSATAHVEIRYP